jgi:outer membrane immunogenic protein
VKKLLLGTAVVFGIAISSLPVIADEAPAAKPIRQARPVEQPIARPAPAATQSNWTGGQVGGQGGAASMAQGFAEPGAHLFFLCGLAALPNCVETPFSFTGHKVAATGGGFLGYRFQVGNMVYGIEGDLNYKSASDTATLYDAKGLVTEAFSGTIKQTGDGSLRARAGMLLTPDILLYVTGGLAVGNVTGSFAYNASAAGVFYTRGAGSWSDLRAGWTAGGGVEYLLLQGWSVRLEYRYTDLGEYSKSVPLTSNCGFPICSSPATNAVINLHPTDNTVRVGLALGF